MNDDEPLIEVYGSSVIPADCYIMLGLPRLVRLDEVIRPTRQMILDRDYAVEVRDILINVKQF